MTFSEKKFEDVKKGRYELVIFGAGRYGKVLQLLLQEQGIRTSCFYDNDPRKTGMDIINGVKCGLPEGDNQNRVCAVSVNDIYGDGIYKQASDLNFAEVIRVYNSELDAMIMKYDDEKCLRILFKSIFGRELDLEHPATFNEKLSWLKLYNRRPEYTTMVDKYAVRKHVADLIGEEYLIPLVGGPWERFSEIDFDDLPNRFVLKVNHDSGSVLLCKDKSEFDYEAAKEKFEQKMKTNFYYTFREWAYKDVKPRIIAEKYMEEAPGIELKDYKIFCFHGEPKIVGVEFDRQKTQFFKTPINNYYSVDKWEYLGFTTTYPTDGSVKITPPDCFPEMLEVARALSKGIPHARIDLYNISGKVYFSEITLTHMGGFSRFSPEEWDERLGSWIDLSKV